MTTLVGIGSTWENVAYDYSWVWLWSDFMHSFFGHCWELWEFFTSERWRWCFRRNTRLAHWPNLSASTVITSSAFVSSQFPVLSGIEFWILNTLPTPHEQKETSLVFSPFSFLPSLCHAFSPVQTTMLHKSQREKTNYWTNQPESNSKPWTSQTKIVNRKSNHGVTGWLSGYLERWTGDPKVEGLNPVRSTRKTEFFWVKKIVLTRCLCAQPLCVYKHIRKTIYAC